MLITTTQHTINIMFIKSQSEGILPSALKILNRITEKTNNENTKPRYLANKLFWHFSISNIVIVSMGQGYYY